MPDTKVIVATRREAHYVLDEILGNATDLPITEHATDTHGVTLVNFGLFDLLGLQLSPRIRDLGRITLYRAAPRAQVESAFPHAGPLLTRKLNLDLIAEHYDDLLRLRTRTERVTAAKIEHTYELWRGAELLADGYSTLACVDREGRVQRLPDFLLMDDS